MQHLLQEQNASDQIFTMTRACLTSTEIVNSMPFVPRRLQSGWKLTKQCCWRCVQVPCAPVTDRGCSNAEPGGRLQRLCKRDCRCSPGHGHGTCSLSVCIQHCRLCLSFGFNDPTAACFLESLTILLNGKNVLCSSAGLMGQNLISAIKTVLRRLLVWKLAWFVQTTVP